MWRGLLNAKSPYAYNVLRDVSVGGRDEKEIRTVIGNPSIRFGFNVCQLQKERRSAATTTSVSSNARANAATTSERC
jgi:hypothetical protein